MAGSAEKCATKDKVFRVDDMDRLRRFLCFGSEGGTYFVKETELTRENASSILHMLEQNRGIEVVEEIKRFSEDGRAAKQSPVIFALAFCAKLSKDAKTKEAAFKALDTVCRVPTHLFQFVCYAEQLAKGANENKTGWGRAQRRAISKWYNEKTPEDLALAVTKYKQRAGWSHTDVVRLAHVKPANKDVEPILMYVAKGFHKTKEKYGGDEATQGQRKVVHYLDIVNTVKHSTDVHQAACLIRDHKLAWEHVPTGLLTKTEIWKALLPHMGLTAVLRNLGRMTHLGVLAEDDQVSQLISRLEDTSNLRDARIHPFTILTALKGYRQRSGVKSKFTWQCVERICDALNKAFYATFKNLTPTGKRFFIAVDMSTSMNYGTVNGTQGITPAMAAATMALVVSRTEKTYDLVVFSNKILPVKLTADMTLEQVLEAIRGEQEKQGALTKADCTEPMRHAEINKLAVDVFLLFTDSQTFNPSGQSPMEALHNYREKLDIPDAKLIVCGLTSNRFSVADPDDVNMLDIAGFDVAAPQVIHDFALGLGS